MIVYEVTAEAESSLAPNFERYMVEKHIPEVLATGKFESMTFAGRDSKYRITYLLKDTSMLDRYIAEDADILREDLKQHFPSGITLTREVFEVITTHNQVNSKAIGERIF